ncbi:MAG: hypothetical protein LBM41_04355 [Ruminococcus sp.]|nr:hypothetical protein [Ruminococcus sp.]
MKHIFLVDFENVHTGGLKGTKLLSDDDELIIFYSENDTDSIDFIRELRDDIQYAKIVKNGQNALDFQLSSYLGFIVHKAVCDDILENTQFVIVSKDSGFDCVAGFWKNTPFVRHLKINPDIIRADNIQAALTTDKTNIDEIIKTSETLNDFHSTVVKKYGMPLGGTIYNENKAKFKEIHNL